MPRSASGAQSKKITASTKETSQLFQHNPLPMWVYDVETLAFLAVNDAAVQSYGYSEAEFLKMTIEDIRPASQFPLLQAHLRETRPDYQRSGEWIHRTKDGRLLTVAITSHLTQYKKRKAVLVVARDISEQRMAEQALHESEERLRLQAELVENVTDAIISCDLDFHIITWNKAAEALYGWKAEEVISQDWDSLCQTNYKEISRKQLTDELFTSGNWRGEFEQRRKDGKHVYVQSYFSIVRSESGVPARIVSVNRDISQSRVTEAALRESEQRFRAAFEQAAVGVAEITPAGVYVNVNYKYCEIVGYSEEELIGHTFHEITHPADVEMTTEKNAALMRGEMTAYSLEKRFIRKDGFIVWVNLSVGIVPDETGKPKYLIGVSQDITERKTRERELEALYEGGTALLQVSDPKDVARKVIALLEQHMEWHHASVWVRHANSEEIEQLAYSKSGQDPEDVQREQEKSRATVRSIHTGLSGWAIGHGEVVRSGDVLSDPRYAVVTESVRSGLYVPLKVGQETIGCITAESTVPNAFTAYDERLLTTVAAQAAIAIENARLFSQIEQQLRQLSALRNIDNAISSNTDLNTTLSIILDHVKSELQVDAADILLFRSETMTLEYAAHRGFRSDAIQRISLRLGEGIAGKTAIDRKPALIENLAEAGGQFHYGGLLSAEQFVTYANAALVSKGQLKGVLEVFHRSPLKTDREWMTFLEMMGNEAAIAIDNADLFNELQRSNLDLTIAYDATIEGWAQALELRDVETEGHSRRVTEMTLQLARQLNIQGAELVHIRRGSLLHDIGKMGVPDEILRKTGPLNEVEWEVMRRHPVLAYHLLSKIPYLRYALDIPYGHHERWDGTGYPRKLRGEQIPLAARVFAVADVYDALISDRPYRKAIQQEDAFNYIREQAGKHFDPKVAQVFLKMMGVE